MLLRTVYRAHNLTYQRIGKMNLKPQYLIAATAAALLASTSANAKKPQLVGVTQEFFLQNNGQQGIFKCRKSDIWQLSPQPPKHIDGAVKCDGRAYPNPN